jgi:hypothetical protein
MLFPNKQLAMNNQQSAIVARVPAREAALLIAYCLLLIGY